MKTKFVLLILVISTSLLAQNNSSRENRFAFSLFTELYNTDSNIFFSPYSLSSAMAMTYNGANGDTKSQIRKVMNFNNDIKKCNDFFNSSNSVYTSYSNSNDFKLNVANALWINNSIKLKGGFKKTIEKYYSAALYPEINATKINKWADDNTNGMIPEIVNESDIAQAQLVLTNAIYFHGTWVHKFDTSKTKIKDFTTAKNEIVQVPMMNQTKKILYYDNREFKMVRLPYEGEKTEMIIILPQEDYNIKTVMEKLTLEKLNSYLKMTEVIKTRLYLPKFKLETTYKLRENLKNMGMKLAFTPDADFSLISKKKLFIDQVIHKAVLDISEEGTEAAAVSAVVMRTTSINKTSFIADHPFIIIIKEKDTANLLFMGAIVNPNFGLK